MHIVYIENVYFTIEHICEKLINATRKTIATVALANVVNENKNKNISRDIGGEAKRKSRK